MMANYQAPSFKTLKSKHLGNDYPLKNPKMDI